MIRTKVEPIETAIKLVVSDLLSPKAQSVAIANYARGQLREAQEVNRSILGRIPPHKTAVDGRPGAPLETVRPNGGVIIFEFELVGDVLKWIADELVRRSPRDSGDYIRGHTIFADGREIRLGAQVPAANEYSFTNTVPYARKLEVGRTKSGRAFLVSKPNRIYERTARDARARFGNIGKITYTFRALAGGGGRRRHGDAAVPTIVITLR